MSAGFYTVLFYTYWYDHVIFFSFILFMCCFSYIDLCLLYQTCIPGINPTWSWCVIFLIYWWIQFANNLLKILASMFISDMACSILLLCFNYFIVQIQVSVFSPNDSPTSQPNPPPSPASTLPLGFVHGSFIVGPENPSPQNPLPPPNWLLSDH